MHQSFNLISDTSLMSLIYLGYNVNFLIYHRSIQQVSIKYPICI